MKRRIVIFATEPLRQAETFIKAHAKFLDGSVHYLNGIFFPKNSEDQKYSLNEFTLLKKICYKLGLQSQYQGFLLHPQLSAYLKEIRPEVALAEYGTVGAHTYKVCKKLDIPLVIHFHGVDAHSHNVLKRYSYEYKEMFDYADRVIAVSEDMKDRLVASGAKPEKVVINPYGPNNKFYKLKSDFKSINFISVGRFVDKKAPDKTIEAFSKLLVDYPEATLSMAGNGPLLDECRQLIRKKQIEKSVKLLGAVSHTEVFSLYQNAYCFLQHSVTAPSGDSEGTPVAILEANAAGLPVISTRHTGIKEVIIHGKNGFLVDEFDVEGMAKHMIEIAGDKTLAKQMGAYGRQRIIDHYSMEKHISTLNDILTKAYR